MIVTCLQGGLGNQLFQYAAGRALSLQTGRKLWLVTALFRHDPQRDYALQPLNIKAGTLNGTGACWLAQAAASHGLLPRLLTTLRFRRRFRYLNDLERGFQASIFTGDGPAVLFGYWQSEKYFQSYANQIHDDCAFRSPPRPEAQGWLNEIEQSTAVAVHVRRGDYVTNPHTAAVHGVCDPDYYQAAADALLRRVAGPTFFVFSDDPDWAEANLHLPGRTKTVRGNQERADHEDLRLMSACRHFIIANSSFSWWGAWLGNANDKCVVAPRRWFQNYRADTKDLLPEGWLQV